MSLSVDHARELLGADLNGHDVLAGHANRHGVTVLTKRPRRFWSWFQRDHRPRAAEAPKAPARRDGSRLIALSAVLLTLLAAGLLSVSIAAQYAYFLSERHQVTASMIESGALDVGMLVFSLLALGLARKGLPARAERALILACATTSAVMNYAPARAGDWRSVLAWTMPPVFLAVVADRVIAVTRRHFLGMGEGRSAWRDGLGWTATAAKVTALGALYVLRVPLAPVSTGKGLRLAVLQATPLPEAPGPTAIESPHEDAAEPPVIEAPEPPFADVVRLAEQWALTHCLARTVDGLCGGTLPCPVLHPVAGRPDRRREPSASTKTARLLELVEQRHGDLAGIPLDQVSRIATALASEVDLHPASARTALLGAVRAALPASEGDEK